MSDMPTTHLCTVELTQERLTKRTVLYTAPADGLAVPPVGTLYVQQGAFEGGRFPKRVRVTVEVADEDWLE